MKRSFEFEPADIQEILRKAVSSEVSKHGYPGDLQVNITLFDRAGRRFKLEDLQLRMDVHVEEKPKP